MLKMLSSFQHRKTTQSAKWLVLISGWMGYLAKWKLCQGPSIEPLHSWFGGGFKSLETLRFPTLPDPQFGFQPDWSGCWIRPSKPPSFAGAPREPQLVKLWENGGNRWISESFVVLFENAIWRYGFMAGLCCLDCFGNPYTPLLNASARSHLSKAAGLFSTLSLLKVDDNKFGDALFIGVCLSFSLSTIARRPHVWFAFWPRTQYLCLFADISMPYGAGSVANLDCVLRIV